MRARILRFFRPIFRRPALFRRPAIVASNVV
jgi:hypothetical protein